MVSQVMEWRNRLVAKGLPEEIADELVVGLPKQLASADDVRRLDGRLDRVEAELVSLRGDVIRIDNRLTNVEQGLVQLRAELQETRREFGEGLQEMRREFGAELQEMRKEFGAELREVRREFGEELRETRQESGREQRAMRGAFDAAQRAQTRILVAAFTIAFGANIGITTALITLLD